jgi:DNA topoisomerase-6 subunit B
MDKAVRREQMEFGFDNESVKIEMKKGKVAKKAAADAEVEAAAEETAPVVEEKKGASRKKPVAAATAESMAAKQRDISISEFFAKNRHLLGFDNPRKALLTTVKEAVDNALDACEEAQILPDLLIQIKEISESKFTIRVRDNGPGIVKQQVPNIFARLLYGSKFHSLKMSRGQQGIGISAAGMYGLLTTGSPVQIISRTSPKKPGYHCHVQIDTAKNRPEVVLDEDCEFELPTGTSVIITLEGRYQKGRQSVDEYLAQTAVANPHATIIYEAPDGNRFEYLRQTKEIPFIPTEIKPHPYGVELGLLFKMARDSSAKKVSDFLRNEFSRVSPRIADDICTKAKLPKGLSPSKMTLQQAEALHKAINETKIMAPSSDCIYPIGQEQLEKGLKRVVEAEFYASCTRSPSVYRGNPFLIEAAIAYGSASALATSDEEDGTATAADDESKDQMMTLMRIANRVPLLYQQSACAMYKSVVETNWRNYGLQQSRGGLPTGQVVLMLNMASVWVPFTSESKEAIAHYPEIIKEMKLAIQECGRKLGAYLRRQRRIKQELMKRGYIEMYLPYIGEALKDILELKDKEVTQVVDKLKIVLEKSRKVG